MRGNSMKKISESATTKTTISNKEKERKDMKRVEKNFNLAEEQKVCNVVISYDCDMKPLYEMLLSKCGKDMPTLVVLETLPEAFIKIGYGFVSSPKNQNKLILLLKKSDNITMQSTLSEAIGAYQNKNSLEFESAYNPTIRFDKITNLAHNDFMYEHALKISSMFKIPCPQIIMQEEEWMKGGLVGYVESYSENDTAVGRIIYIKKGAGVCQLRALAHELRHCWQEKYGDGKNLYANYNSENPYEYFYNENEIDAEAFSCKYVKDYKGYSDIVQLIYGAEDGDEFRKYVLTIKQRMEKIKLAA